jgi:hypothetical protein
MAAAPPQHTLPEDQSPWLIATLSANPSTDLPLWHL